MAEKTSKGAKWRNSGAYNSVDMYEEFCKTSDTVITKEKYKEILSDCNREFMRLVLLGKEVRLPNLSTMYISKHLGSKKQVFDYDRFNKTGEKTFITNEHSNGFKGAFHWAKNNMPIVGGRVYSFVATRKLQRSLSVEMKTPGGHTKYTEYGR